MVVTNELLDDLTQATLPPRPFPINFPLDLPSFLRPLSGLNGSDCYLFFICYLAFCLESLIIISPPHVFPPPSVTSSPMMECFPPAVSLTFPPPPWNFLGAHRASPTSKHQIEERKKLSSNLRPPWNFLPKATSLFWKHQSKACRGNCTHKL